MTLQQQLFAPIGEQNTNPQPVKGRRDTSRAAAKSVVGHTKTLRGQVYVYISQQREKGATDAEIQMALGMSGNTERPRRQELETQKLIADSGQTRATSSGRPATVWVAKEFAAKKK